MQPHIQDEEESPLELESVDAENDDCFVGSNKNVIESFLASISIPENGTMQIDGTDNNQEEFQIDVGDNGQIQAQEQEIEQARGNSEEAIQMEDQQYEYPQTSNDAKLKKMREKFYYL